MTAPGLTSSQTVGPFFSGALLREDARRNVLVGPETADAWPDFLFSLDGGMHLCPRCHRLLPEGARYCLHCGESVVSPFNAAQTTLKS